MPADHVDVVLVHGAWADGTSWSKVIGPLEADGINVVAAPLPLTSLADDVAALGCVPERIDGPVVVADHAYAGAVIGTARGPKAASLVYVAALAPEGETVSDVFYRGLRRSISVACISVPVDDTPLVTAPEEVVDIILDAVRDVATATQPAGRACRIATASALN